MKKIILILMLATFMSVTNVNAEELDISCSNSINLMKPNNFIAGVYKPFDYSPSSIGSANISYNGLIAIKPSTSYHFRHSGADNWSPQQFSVVF